jgi:Threonine dehydrogenase and related Zn-dependent dehydrogenases
LIRVTAVGLCGSDRHWFNEGSIGDAALSRPLVLGHEIAGIVETGPRRGQRVAVDPADPCGDCDLCLTGRDHLCLALRFAGHGTVDGGLRSLMAWPRRLLAPLPDAIKDPDAALLEPLGVALHAIDLGRVRPGMSAGVFGCGPIGLLLVQVLRGMGVSPIVAIDPLPHRLAAAASMGATEVGAPSSGAREEDRMTHGTGPPLDAVFEAAGEDGAVADAIAAVRPGGRAVLVGIPASDRTSFRASVARHKGLTILLSRRMRAPDLPRAIGMVEAGMVDLASLISGRYLLDQASMAFDDLSQQRGLKVVVKPSG